MRTKAEAFSSYRLFAAWVKTQLEIDIKCLHSDRGGEYLSGAFIQYLDEKGTERKLTVHDTPEENGVAECLNHTLMAKVRAMMIASKLPFGLWGEALMHTVYLKNRTWTRSLPNGATPFEMINGERPLFKDVPIWGSIMWVHDISSGKLGVRATEAR
jgi:transposase InsO family protein